MLSTKLNQLVLASANDIKSIISKVGDLSQLSDGDKNNLVAALNSLHVYSQTYLSNLISDSAPSASNAYSAQKIDATIAAAIQLIKLGAPESFDTLKEIADWISGDQSQTSNILTSLEKLVRFDTTMSLTDVQKSTVHSTVGLNIGLIDLQTLYAAQLPKKFKDVEFYVPNSLGGRIFQIIGDDVSQVAIVDTSARAPYPPNQFLGSEFSSDGALFISYEGYYSGYMRQRVVVHKRNANGTFTESAYYDNSQGEYMLASKKHKVVYKQQTNQIRNFAMILNETGIIRNDVFGIGMTGKLAESRDGSKIASATSFGQLGIYNVVDGNPMTFTDAGFLGTGQFGAGATNNSLAFSYDGKMLLSAQKHNALNKFVIAASADGSFANGIVVAEFTAPGNLHPRGYWVDGNMMVVQQGYNLLFYRIAFDGSTITANLIKTHPIATGMIIDGVTDDGRHIFMRTLAGGMRILRHVGEYQYDTLTNVTTGPTTLEQSHTTSRLLD